MTIGLPFSYTTPEGIALLALLIFNASSAVLRWYVRGNTRRKETESDDFSVLPCIANRCSIFPKRYLRNPPPLDPRIVQSLLDAAICGPYHGKCSKGHDHPAQLVVLGKQAMVEMQHLTLDYYDKHWMQGWGSGRIGTEQEYQAWRTMTHGEIEGRWGPCSYMIAVIMRRQSGPKRLPEWEEATAVAAAVQNMHLQSTKFSHLACYWSSWHDAARDSAEMKAFLGMQQEDKCLGFFIVAQKDKFSSSRRSINDGKRKALNRSMAVEWRK